MQLHPPMEQLTETGGVHSKIINVYKTMYPYMVISDKFNGYIQRTEASEWCDEFAGDHKWAWCHFGIGNDYFFFVDSRIAAEFALRWA